MDYKDKYIKYKIKYLQLKNKNNMIGGNYEEFINNVIKIFNYITIKNDEARDYIPIQNIFEYKQISIGGYVTYNIDKNININSEIMKTYKFPPNIGIVDCSKPNIIIIGGGPVGLYMSILLKYLYRDMNIYVLEKRHDKLLKRNLTRSQVLLLSKLTLKGNWIFYKQFIDLGIYSLITEEEYYNNLFSFVPDIFKSLFINNQTKCFSFINFLDEDITTIPINILEYKLAKYAQTIGVNIFHTEEITMKNLQNYVNINTKIILDATGGHLRRFFDATEKPIFFYYQKISETLFYSYSGYNIISTEINKEYIFIDDNNIIIRSDYGDIYYTSTNFTDNEEKVIKNKDGKNIEITLKNKSEPFQIITGNLAPNEAVTKINDIPLISIGDSYMKTNFKNGCGLYYGFVISFLIAYELHNSFPIF
jgi:hypothetical protein